MVENADRDYAIAVALSESNEAFSDDDFRPSVGRPGHDQRLLLKAHQKLKHNSPPKQVRKKRGKKDDCPIQAGNASKDSCNAGDSSKGTTRKNNVRTEVNEREALPRQSLSSAIHNDAERSKSLSIAALDDFRMTKGLQGIHNRAVTSMQIESKGDGDTLKSGSIMKGNSSPQSDAEGVPGRLTTAAESSDDCWIVDINTEEEVELSNESQFSTLLRLCDEEYEHLQKDLGSDNSEGEPAPKSVDALSGQCGSTSAVLLADSAVNRGVPLDGAVEGSGETAGNKHATSSTEIVSQGAAARGVDGEGGTASITNVVDPPLSRQENTTEAANLQDEVPNDNADDDDISEMMTQKRLSQSEEIDAFDKPYSSPQQPLTRNGENETASTTNVVDPPLSHQENTTEAVNVQGEVFHDSADDGDISEMMTQKSPSQSEEIDAFDKPDSSPQQPLTRIDEVKQSVIKMVSTVSTMCIDKQEDEEETKITARSGSNLQSQRTRITSEEGHGSQDKIIIEQYRIRASRPAVSGNGSERYLSGEDLGSGVQNAEEVEAIIICPVCGNNISGISVEARIEHTNACLDKPASVQEAGVRTSPSLAPDPDRVRVWLESLSLSRYARLFVEQEIDWDTLQWLTEEDLFVMGITTVGPRRKILGALQELKSGNRDNRAEPLQNLAAVSSLVEEMNNSQQVQNPAAAGGESSRNLQGSGVSSCNPITNYFPLPLDGETKQREANNKPSTSFGPETILQTTKAAGVYKNRATKRPRNAVYQNLSGIPAWKCIPGTPFRVDAFQHLGGDCCHWFLTHFHTDHYQGLTRGFRYGRIFCSLITARLVNLRIGVSWDKLMIIPLNEKVNIAGVDVTFIDANHCPGSVMILFEPSNGEAVLHTGDFRFCTDMVNNSLLQTTRIHTLVLDTTYCDPQYDFPSQATVIQFVVDAIQAELFNSDTLFLIGTYTIGKERIFLEVGKVLKKYVYVGAPKRKLLECMDLPADDAQWLTCNEHESFIHVVPLWSISSFKRMTSISRHYQGRYKVIVAFSPSGWNFGKGKKKTPGKRWQQGTMIRYEVPYSEHCSFSELKEFLKFVGPDDIIPSVPGKKDADEMIASLWSEDN